MTEQLGLFPVPPICERLLMIFETIGGNAKVTVPFAELSESIVRFCDFSFLRAELDEGFNWKRSELSNHFINDILANGMSTPISVDVDFSGIALKNGHHRYVVAMDYDLEFIPVTNWWTDGDGIGSNHRPRIPHPVMVDYDWRGNPFIATGVTE